MGVRSMRIAMDRNKKIGLGFVGNLSTNVKIDESIVVARIDNFDPFLLLQGLTYF